MENMELHNEVKAYLLENKKVTLMEKGNHYDVWELVQTARGIKWKNHYAGKSGTVKDLTKFFEHIPKLILIRVL